MLTIDFIRDRITQLRLQKGVSEYKMSYDLGHSRGYINNISSGKTLPSMVEFIAICEYFNITPAEFFQEEIQNPHVMRSIHADIAALGEKDLQLVQMILRRLSEK